MAANSKIAKAFRTRVRERMTQKNLTIADLADGLKMSRPGLSRVLNGHSDVTLTRAAKIAAFLDIEVLLHEKNGQPA